MVFKAVSIAVLLIAGLWLGFLTLANAQCPTHCPGYCSDPDVCEWNSIGPTDYCTYPETGCPTNYTANGGCCCWNGCPIVVGLSDTPVQLTNAAEGVWFDLFASKHPERIAWTTPGNGAGWLALDRDGNGSIDDGTELFGNVTPQPSSTKANGFLALAVYDQPSEGGNGDGIIDDRDAVFAALRIWVDRNHDGVSQPGELPSLIDAGVVSIDLAYRESRRTDRWGNGFRYRAKVTHSHGTHLNRWAWDVFVVAKPHNW